MKSITHYLYKIQLFFESHFSLVRLVYTLFLALGIVFFLDTVFTIQHFFSQKLIISLLCFLVIAFTIFDYFHLKLIRDQRKDLDARRQLISDYIASVEPDYDYAYLKETHIIKPNGDGKYIRNVKLKYSGNNATWYSLDFGATSPLSDLAGLGFHVKAYKYPIKAPLARITFPKSDRKMQAIIILDPPLSRSNNEIELVIEANWPEIWNEAIEFGQDHGRISLYKQVEFLHLEFIPPKNKRIENFILEDSRIEQAIIKKNNLDGSVECIIQNPSRGIFNYRFELVSV